MSVRHIQTQYTYLIPPQVCWRLWQGCRSGVQAYLHQFIAWLHLKHVSSYLFKTSFLDCWLICISFTGSALIFLILVWACVSKFSRRSIQTGHIDFIPLQVCGSSWRGCSFLWFNLSSSIYWFSSSQSYQVLQFCSYLDKFPTKGYQGPLG